MRMCVRGGCWICVCVYILCAFDRDVENADTLHFSPLTLVSSLHGEHNMMEIKKRVKKCTRHQIQQRTEKKYTHSTKFGSEELTKRALFLIGHGVGVTEKEYQLEIYKKC